MIEQQNEKFWIKIQILIKHKHEHYVNKKCEKCVTVRANPGFVEWDNTI